MQTTAEDRPLPRLFATCPPSPPDPSAAREYRDRVTEVSRWSERHGCDGILVYTDNGLVDPWMVARLVIESTTRLAPLVAVQPVYMHPYAVAKLVASIGYLDQRRVFLNLVAGGFRNDLQALGDPTPHDQRYARLVEYGTVIQRLLRGGPPVTFQGAHYRTEALRLAPALAPELQPGIFVSGSSDAGLAAARALDALAVEYPHPSSSYAPDPDPRPRGIRIGVIARDDAEEAWAIAHRRFPPDRKGQIAHQMAMKVSDSAWHRQLSELARSSAQADHPYWLVPFENYKTFCPYLVGSHDRVAEELARYLEAGYGTFILDVPASEDDLEHTRRAMARATTLAAR